MWNWQIFWRYLFDADILTGAASTVKAAVVAQLLGVALALALGLMISSWRPLLKNGAALYVWFFRGTPVLLQILAFFFVPPAFGVHLDVATAGVLALGLNEAAYLAEVVRGGLLSVGKGQREAARGLGLSGPQTLRFVILPQAMRIMLPSIGTSFNSMLKTTALLSAISFEELLRASSYVVDLIYRPFELYAIASIYYLAMTTAWSIVQGILEAHYGAQSARGWRQIVAHLLPSGSWGVAAMAG